MLCNDGVNSNRPFLFLSAASESLISAAHLLQVTSLIVYRSCHIAFVLAV